MSFEQPRQDKPVTVEYLQKGWFGQRVEVKVSGTEQAVLKFCEKHLDHGKVDFSRLVEQTRK